MNTVIRKIGNSESVILPKEALEEMGWTSGDRLRPVPSGNDLRLVRESEEQREEMALAREVMDKYRDALSKLAK